MGNMIKAGYYINTDSESFWNGFNDVFSIY